MKTTALKISGLILATLIFCSPAFAVQIPPLSICQPQGKCDADANGIIDNADIFHIKKYILRTATTCGYQGDVDFCDIDGNGYISSRDALFLGKMIADFQGHLNITVEGQGSVAKNPDKVTYAYNEVVTLTATAAVGYAFSNWSGDLGGSTNPTTITVNSDKNVSANFIANNPVPSGEFSLQVTNGTGSGTYAPGEFANISAVVPAGQYFDQWVVEYDLDNTPGIYPHMRFDNRYMNSTTVIMPPKNATLTATFRSTPRVIKYINPSTATPGNGTLANPYPGWDTIGNQWEADTVYLQKRDTTSPLNLNNGMLINKSNIIISAYGLNPNGPNERPVLFGNRNKMINIIGTENVILRDLDITNISYGNNLVCIGHANGPDGIFIPANDTLIEDCKIHHGYNGIRLVHWATIGYLRGFRSINNEIYDIDEDGIFGGNINEVEIGYNHIHKVNQVWLTTGTAPGDGVQMNSWDGFFRIHHSIIDRSDTGEKFAFIYSTDGLHFDTTVIFEHNIVYSPKQGGEGGSPFLISNAAKNFIMRYNRIINTQPTEALSLGAMLCNAQNIYMYYNTFENFTQGPTIGLENPEVTKTRRGYILNNTFYRSFNGTHDEPDIYLGGIDEGVIKNNIFIYPAGRTDPILRNMPISASFGNNLFSYQFSGMFANSGGNGNTSYVLQPTDKLANGSAVLDPTDMHLLANSLAIDSGAVVQVMNEYGNMVTLTKDIDSDAVPAGNAPDIGFDEYFAPGMAPLIGNLVVQGGAGTSIVEEGETVSISADPAPVGMEFSAWTGDTSVLEDPAQPDTKLIMPLKSVKLQAVYKSVQEDKPYKRNLKSKGFLETLKSVFDVK